MTFTLTSRSDWLVIVVIMLLRTSTFLSSFLLSSFLFKLLRGQQHVGWTNQLVLIISRHYLCSVSVSLSFWQPTVIVRWPVPVKLKGFSVVLRDISFSSTTAIKGGVPPPAHLRHSSPWCKVQTRESTEPQLMALLSCFSSTEIISYKWCHCCPGRHNTLWGHSCST